MNNLRKALLGLIIGTSLLYACSNDNEMSRSDKTEPTSVLSSKEKSVRYKILDYDNLESRNEALNELANYYLEEVYINNEFDSRYQVATAIFEDYKDLKK